MHSDFMSCSIDYTIDGVVYGTDFLNVKEQEECGVEEPLSSIHWIDKVKI